MKCVSSQLLLCAILWCTHAQQGFQDNFTRYNTSEWIYANDELFTGLGAVVYYEKNHSKVNHTLSKGQGKGLVIVMEACQHVEDGCKGSKMASGHLQTAENHLYGDYELRMRAPYTVDGDGTTCSEGIYAYFTAGFYRENDTWNEVNFGFHPDRDVNGTCVSCEHHADTGGYKTDIVNIGFNYREDFHTYVIRVRENSLEWLVDGRRVHNESARLTHPMHTSLILRTSFREGDPGVMPTAYFEIEYFRYTPDDGTAVQ
eukprot:m.118021 g.118021  ORF g.118021 m.118021 type:complete len:258 (-) comp17196_c0_seq2:595-1368(-)